MSVDLSLDLFDRLPTELLQEVFSWLSYKNTCRLPYYSRDSREEYQKNMFCCLLVCKRWNAVLTTAFATNPFVIDTYVWDCTVTNVLSDSGECAKRLTIKEGKVYVFNENWHWFAGLTGGIGGVQYS